MAADDAQTEPQLSASMEAPVCQTKGRVFVITEKGVNSLTVNIIYVVAENATVFYLKKYSNQINRISL